MDVLGKSKCDTFSRHFQTTHPLTTLNSLLVVSEISWNEQALVCAVHVRVRQQLRFEFGRPFLLMVLRQHGRRLRVGVLCLYNSARARGWGEWGSQERRSGDSLEGAELKAPCVILRLNCRHGEAATQANGWHRQFTVRLQRVHQSAYPLLDDLQGL
jgi:hypothetical protein